MLTNTTQTHTDGFGVYLLRIIDMYLSTDRQRSRLVMLRLIGTNKYIIEDSHETGPIGFEKSCEHYTTITGIYLYKYSILFTRSIFRYITIRYGRSEESHSDGKPLMTELTIYLKKSEICLLILRRMISKVNSLTIIYTLKARISKPFEFRH